MHFILYTFLVFQFDISGSDISELQKENKLLISVTLSIFQFDISGNDINEWH